MASALDWLMQQLGDERQDATTIAPQMGGYTKPVSPDPSRVADAFSGAADAASSWYDGGRGPANLAWGMTGIPDLQEARQAYDRGEYGSALWHGGLGAANAAGTVIPVARGIGAVGKFAAPVVREMASAIPGLLADEAGALNPRFTIRKSYDLPADGAGEKNAYAIHSPEGAPVGGAHITISPDGRVADVGNVWAGDPDLPNNIALDPSAANAANTLGPRAMRQVALDFFHRNPSVEEIMGERLSGARETPGGASVTRSQLSGALDQLRQLLGDESGALRLPGGGPIRAYHGSPYDFNAFDSSKIGTGEGNQSYGHGLYFAEKPEVAASYKQSEVAMSQIDKLLRDNRGQQMTDPDIAALLKTFPALKHLSENGQAVSAIRGLLPSYDPAAAVSMDSLRHYRALDDAVNKGRMYEVNLHADPARLLEWDKPLSEQSSQVRDALFQDRGMRGFMAGNPDATGEALYRYKTNPTGWGYPEKGGASETLRHYGIPGVKYLDQGSRGAGEGTSNYVMFDDKLIEILRKYGLAGLTAGTGAAALGGSAEAAPADALDRIKRQLGEGAF